MVPNSHSGPLFRLGILAGYNAERDVGNGEMAIRGNRQPGAGGCHGGYGPAVQVQTR